MLNVVCAIPVATLSAIRARLPKTAPDGTVAEPANPLPAAAETMLRDHASGLWRETSAGVVYSMQAESEVDIRALEAEFPPVTILGVWDMATGLPAGQEYVPAQDPDLPPTVAGTPTWPFREALWREAMPLERTYDADGNLLSEAPYAALQQVHLWAGQAERIW